MDTPLLKVQISVTLMGNDDESSLQFEFELDRILDMAYSFLRPVYSLLCQVIKVTTG